MPSSVLIIDTPSTPASTTLEAISTMSVTSGDSFAKIGDSLVHSWRTVEMTSAAEYGLHANTCPRLSTFGQEIFTSSPPIPSTSFRMRASSPNSSTLFPAIETIVVTLFSRSQAKSFSKKLSMPGPCNPIELSMPLGVSAMRGVARPDRAFFIMLLVTTAPRVVKSPNWASSFPAAAQPDAVAVGPLSESAPRLVVKSTLTSDHQLLERQECHLELCRHHPSECDLRGKLVLRHMNEPFELRHHHR